MGATITVIVSSSATVTVLTLGIVPATAVAVSGVLSFGDSLHSVSDGLLFGGEIVVIRSSIWYSSLPLSAPP
jgi:hypothetical protein